MGHNYKFITSTAAYDGFPKGECIPISFIALLKSISYRNTHFLLELQNFTNGQPDELPYMVKLRCVDKDSKKLAKMTLSLLFQTFDIETPETILDESFALDRLHLQSLCFLKCECLYASKDTTYTVFLDEIKPLNMKKVISTVLNQRLSPEGKILNEIFQNLMLMDKNPAEQFKFTHLNNYNSDFSKFIDNIRGTARVRTARSNPLFTANQLRSPVDSQNEFDSQFLGPAGSFDTLGFDSVADTQSPEVLRPAEQARKRPKHDSSPLHANVSTSAALGSVAKLVGRMVGMYPVGSDTGRAFQLYFVPHDWPCLEDTNLVPDVNCLEIIVPPGTRLHELFNDVYEYPAKFADILKQENLPVEILRSRWVLRDGLHSSRWVLQRVGQQEEMLDRVEKPITALRSPHDPLLTFKDLEPVEGQFKFVRMIGLLVSCTFENTNFISMVFTDFTSNANITQKLLFDPFLIDFNNRIESHQGFRGLMYRDKFPSFNDMLYKIYSYKLEDMFLPSAGENVSHKGIVCKMSIKYKLYQGRLNAVIKQCEPIPRNYIPCYEDERLRLKTFYLAATSKLTPEAIARFQDNYSKCFPPLPDPSHTLCRPQSPRNMLQIDSLSDYEFKTATDIAQLNQLQNEVHTLYRVEGQVLALSGGLRDTHLEILISNDIISADYVDPTRIVRIAIPTGDSQRFFFSASGLPPDQAIQELRELIVGEELQFRILRRAVHIAGFHGKIAMAMIWCPIECTSEELRSQTLQTSQVKLQEQDSLHHPTTMVKAEAE